MIAISGYHVYEQIYEGFRSRIYRARRNSDRQPVILKVLKNGYPTPAERRRYQREYDILDSLNLHGVIRVYDLHEYQHTLIMVLEDFGGESLQNLIMTRRFTLEESLVLAIHITQILGELHAARVTHNNIHPSHIVWTPETGEVKLIDFSMATALLKESSALPHQNILEENLAYMSPEQTGRMNRTVDYRTDFYSLGVTLHRLLTAKLPFETTDPMELVHSHIAKQPVPLNAIQPDIPNVVSDIVLKLLNKTAEERFQSAWGIQADLEKCLEQLRATGTVLSFPLASQDIPDRFHLSQKLYGREHEMATLLSTFGRICEGNCEMILVSGYAGVGKTTLVHEISRPVMEKRGYFISGKFDQLHHHIPYSAIIKAFQELVRYLLRESEAALCHWREELIAGLGASSQVIIDVIPEVEFVIGPQPPVPELGALESQNRFTLAFQHFIRTFCQEQHPVVLFLDDVQWIDAASLRLIASMMDDVDMHHFLFIGAYRENEVDTPHPLMNTLDTVRQESGVVNQITLGSLQLGHIIQLLADVLRCDRKTLAPLANLVMRKTGGNPFFINQFLTLLYQEDLLSFNVQQRRWAWAALSRINELDITENVVELITGTLKKLPEPTQRVLRLAACIGNQFDVRILSIASEKTTTDTMHDLFSAVQKNLIVPLPDLDIVGGRPDDESPGVYEYKFLHDRVQQAAYALIQAGQRTSVHLAIGRLLLKHLTPQEQDKQIFSLVNQLNRGRELLTDTAERETLVELNLSAGKKAKASNAFERASDYLEIARTLLGNASWETQHDLTFTVYKESAECEYSIGNFDQCSRLLHIALDHCESGLEKGYIFLVRITQHSLQGNYKQAFQLGIEALQILEVTLPDPHDQHAVDRFFRHELEWFIHHWQDKQIVDLYDLPLNEEPLPNLIVSILAAIVDIASLTFPSFLGAVTITMVNASVKHGNTAMSPFGYLFYGTFLFGALKDYEAAYQFGELSLKLNEEKIHNINIRSRILDIFGCCLSFLKHRLQKSIELLDNAYQAGWRFGDVVYAAYAITNKVRFFLSTGLNLSEVIEENEKALHWLQKLHNAPIFSLNQVYTGFVLNLQGNTPHPLSFDYGTFHEEEFHQSFSHVPLIFTFYENYKLQSFYYLENYDRALSLVSRVDTTTKDILLEGEEFRFFAALTLLAVYPEATHDDKRRYAERFDGYHAAIHKLAAECPLNFRAHDRMLSAERARLDGHMSDAIEGYEDAIAAAREGEFLHQEALANELAAKFWRERGNERFARLYMTEAHQCYQRWGATAKVNILQQKYPNLLLSPAIDAQILPSTLAGHLDLRAVLKASQAISGEIHLEKLLAAIMKIIIEHAGAEKGLFLMNADERLTIEASITADSDRVDMLESVPVEQSQEVPTAIVNYVNRTAQHVVLHDASREEMFAHDPYVLESHPKSILCMPVCYQDSIVGVLYLENNLTTHAFTEDRLAILNVLVTQAAISLENAKLFERSKRAEEKLKKMNQELQEQNLFIKTLIDISPDAIYIYDLADTKNMFVSESIQRALGYSEEGIKAMGSSVIPQLMYPEDFTRYNQRILPKYAELHDGEIFEHEYRMKHHDGTWRWLRSKELIFKRLPDHSPWQIFGVVSDITDRKRTDEQIKNQNLLLEQAVREKQQEMEALFERLLRQEKLATIGQIAGNIAHELRNPLGVIKNSAFFLKLLWQEQKMTPSNPKVLEHLDVIDDELNASERVIAYLLQMNRTKPLQREQTDVRFLVEDAVERCHVPEQIRVILDFESEPLFIWVDFVQVRQVVLNLLSNAVQAIEKDGSITVRAKQSAKDKTCTIEIEDSGPGIAPDALDKIFEPLYTTKAAGTGLGLSICKQIVEHHQGQLSLRSALGQGATVRIVLPDQGAQQAERHGSSWTSDAQAER